MINIVELLSVPRPERPSKSSRYFQNGVTYRTLCKKCNGDQLGVQYDPALIALANEVRAYLGSALHLPSQMQVKTKPNRLARCIVGHLLAYGVGEHRNGAILEKLTDYFLDEVFPFPKELKLYYWVYPYNDQVIVKGAGVSLHYWNSFAVCMLLKFFPLSFFFVLDEPPKWRVPFRRLDTMLTSSIDDEAILSIDFTGLPPQRWPEAPGKSGMVIYGDGASGVIPRSSNQ